MTRANLVKNRDALVIFIDTCGIDMVLVYDIDIGVTLWEVNLIYMSK